MTYLKFKSVNPWLELLSFILKLMKRFAAAALLLAFAYADGHEEAEETMDETKEQAEDQLKDAWDATSNWFSARQEPVAYESIMPAEGKCSLSGHYGWFQRVGIDMVFIRETVGDCPMEEGNIALTWAEMDDPDTPGVSEAFYCAVTYRDGKPAALQTDIRAKTMDGKNIDMAAWASEPESPEVWCSAQHSNGDCERHTTDAWNRVVSEPQTNFPYTSEGSMQSTSCTLFRTSTSPNETFEIKNGTPYTVRTGYILYKDEAAMQAGEAGDHGAGAAVEMTFSAAATLLAGAAAAVAATVF